MPTFAELWASHPTIKGEAPLLDTKVYENQCAINLSASLMRSGIDLTSFTGVRSWEQGKPKYPIRAEELAGWLDRNAALLPSRITKFFGRDVPGSFENINGKTGVIFLKDYYGPGQNGDHIDLFSRNRMTSLFSWFRIATGFSYEGRFSDYRKSKAIWFWEVK